METPTNIPPTDPDVEPEISIQAADNQQAETPSSPAPTNPVRTVNFILDPSAFTLGLGNIERWFDEDYFRSQVKNKNEKIHLNLYLSTYTLHELDYQRRGPIVGSTKASEALKFIDRKLESDNGLLDNLGDDLEPEAAQASADEKFSYSLHLEHRTYQFPQWPTCAKFQIRNPDPEELPNHGKYSLYDEINHLGGDVQGRAGEKLEVPARLKHLIRSAIYLTRMKHNGPADITGDMWKLVTEDTVTKVWASCFGVDCLNINEAELLLFHGKDLTKFEIKGQGADFFSGEDKYQAEAPDTLHKKVNTTHYKYTHLKADENANNKKRDGRRKGTTKAPQKAISSQSEPQESDESKGVKVEGGVITEDFNMINFAPREETTKLVTSKLFLKESKPSSKARNSGKAKSEKSIKNAEAAQTDKNAQIPEKSTKGKKAQGKRKASRKVKGLVTQKEAKAKDSDKALLGPEGSVEATKAKPPRSARKKMNKKKTPPANETFKKSESISVEASKSSEGIS
ncbi:hypothetical protein OY671_001923 [Metschnikowia pulcherrima]|nr:hypothetical protein OY671_001923 [Metschnikowia pulcherrima]